MPIPVVCPRCNKRMRAHDALAGTTAKCTGCQYDVEVPFPAPEPVQPTGLDKEVLDGLKAIDRHLVVLRRRTGCIFYFLLAWFALSVLGCLILLATGGAGR